MSARGLTERSQRRPAPEDESRPGTSRPRVYPQSHPLNDWAAASDPPRRGRHLARPTASRISKASSTTRRPLRSRDRPPSRTRPTSLTRKPRRSRASSQEPRADRRCAATGTRGWLQRVLVRVRDEGRARPPDVAHHRSAGRSVAGTDAGAKGAASSTSQAMFRVGLPRGELRHGRHPPRRTGYQPTCP